MAGSPLKRQRKQGVRLADGSIIAFPYMPRGTNLPPGWRHFSTAEKIEHLIGLDRCYEILSSPSVGLDPMRLSMKVKVVRALLDCSLGRDVARERERERRLARLVSELPSRRTPPKAVRGNRGLMGRV
jgi:hypothetical protein